MKQSTIIKLFNITRQTWSNWKKEKKPIVSLIETYFNDKDIEEFIETGRCSKFDSIYFNDDEQISSKGIANSLRGELGEKKKNTRNWFQHQIILMYRAFEQKETDINDTFKKEDLIKIIQNYDIKLLRDKWQNGITQKDKEDTIKFISKLENIQVNYIINNIEEFLQILWDNRNWENTLITSDNKPK